MVLKAHSCCATYRWAVVCLGFWSWSWSLLESLKLMFGKIFGVLVWLIMFCSWSLLEIPKLTTGRESAFYRVGLVWTFFQNLQHRCQKIRERGWKVDRSEKIQVSQKRKDFNKSPKSFFSGHLMVDRRVLDQKVKSTSFVCWWLYFLFWMALMYHATWISSSDNKELITTEEWFKDQRICVKGNVDICCSKLADRDRQCIGFDKESCKEVLSHINTHMYIHILKHTTSFGKRIPLSCPFGETKKNIKKDANHVIG